MKNKIAGVWGCFVLFVAVSGCENKELAKQREVAHYAACVDRGVAYFKEIGSYPTLSSEPNRGRQASIVAGEHCSRTLDAY
jgi:hypothetical protein